MMTKTRQFFLSLFMVLLLNILVDGASLPSKLSWARRVLTSAAVAIPLSATGIPGLAQAFGPTELSVNVASYKAVDLCNGKKPIMPGQKAMEGLFPVCVEVEAEVANPAEKTLKDVSVYGFVKENNAGNSVLPNNPDFRSDSGQYAMIKEVPPGTSKVTYQFVAAVSGDPKVEGLPPLTFFKTKGSYFPDGKKVSE